MDQFKKENFKFFDTKLDHKRRTVSQSWLSDWKSRNDVVFRKIYAENNFSKYLCTYKLTRICLFWKIFELLNSKNT